MAYWVLATVGWATRSDGISANGRAAVLGDGDERVRVVHDTILIHAATSMTYGGDRRHAVPATDPPSARRGRPGWGVRRVTSRQSGGCSELSRRTSWRRRRRARAVSDGRGELRRPCGLRNGSAETDRTRSGCPPVGDLEPRADWHHHHRLGWVESTPVPTRGGSPLSPPRGGKGSHRASRSTPGTARRNTNRQTRWFSTTTRSERRFGLRPDTSGRPRGRDR